MKPGDLVRYIHGGKLKDRIGILLRERTNEHPAGGRSSTWVVLIDGTTYGLIDIDLEVLNESR